MFLAQKSNLPINLLRSSMYCLMISTANFMYIFLENHVREIKENKQSMVCMCVCAMCVCLCVRMCLCVYIYYVNVCASTFVFRAIVCNLIFLLLQRKARIHIQMIDHNVSMIFVMEMEQINMNMNMNKNSSSSNNARKIKITYFYFLV